jgi:hypothetical protein
LSLPSSALTPVATQWQCTWQESTSRESSQAFFPRHFPTTKGQFMHPVVPYPHYQLHVIYCPSPSTVLN